MYQSNQTNIYKYTDFLIIFIFTALFFLFRYKIINGDSLLAWPITESFTNKDLYPLDDLIIKSGKEGIFHFYKLLHNISFFKDNYPLRDFLIYLPIFFIYSCLWFLIFVKICENRELSLLALAFFLFSDKKLGLNWSNSPMPILVSLSSVHWLQVLSLYLFLQKRYKTSLFLLALTGYFHPGSSISYFLVLTSILIYKAYREKNLKILTSIIIYLITSSINFYLIVKNSESYKILPPEYFQIFNIFQYHAFLDDHFKEGYIYTFVLILMIVLYWRGSKKRPNYSSVLFLFLIFSLLWGIAWFLNLYLFKNTTFLHTLYITRIFYLLKPLIILFFVLTLYDIVEKKKQVDYLILALLSLATILLFSPIVSTILLLSFVSYLYDKRLGFFILFLCITTTFLVFWQIDSKNFKLLILKNYSYNKLIPLEILMGLLTCFFLRKIGQIEKLKITKKTPHSFLIAAWLSVFLIFFVSDRSIQKIKIIAKNGIFSELNFENYFGIRDVSPEFAMLLDWVSNFNGKMFIVPPAEYEFLSLRYFTKNGIFISEFDINQLMYSPKYYLEGFKRLNFLGLKVLGRHKTSYKSYGSLSLDVISKVGADYVIFNKSNVNFVYKAVQPVYENNKYIVYKLK